MLDITGDKPLADIDIGQYAHVLNNRGLGLRDSVDHALPAIVKFYEDILRGKYSEYIRKLRCIVCLDVVDAAGCRRSQPRASASVLHSLQRPREQNHYHHDSHDQ